MDQSGRPVEWTVRIRGDRVSPPTVTEDGVYVGDDQGLVYKLDPISGDTHWEFDTTSTVNGPPAVLEDFVYVSTDEGVYAIDKTAGTIRWAHSTKKALSTGPTIGGDWLYVGDTGGTVSAINRSTGDNHWRYNTGHMFSRYPIRSAITVADEAVYFGTDQSLYAVSATSGEERWRYNNIRGCAGTPTVADGIVYAGGYDGKLHAIEAATGAVNWEFPTDDKISAGPTVAGETVFVGSHDQTLYAIDRQTASQQWEFSTDGEIRTSPTVAAETVYIGTPTGQLYALNINDGTEWWRHRLSGAAGTPVVYGGTIYINDESGHVSAIDTTHQSASHDSRILYGAIGHHSQQLTTPPTDGFTAAALDREITSGRATPVQPTRIYGLGVSPEQANTDSADEPQCPECDRHIDRDGAAFCPHCGASLSVDISGDTA